MPIYEYRCTACGHEFEKIQRVSERAIRSCPECKGKVEKLVSVSAFSLKGGGWYAQGYSQGGGGSKGAGKSSEGSKSSTSTKKSSSSSSASD
jgi:putative FmdB family regulatory protein